MWEEQEEKSQCHMSSSFVGMPALEYSRDGPCIIPWGSNRGDEYSIASHAIGLVPPASTFRHTKQLPLARRGGARLPYRRGASNLKDNFLRETRSNFDRNYDCSNFFKQKLKERTI
ncbi:hypothetical protein PoB_001938500 [Plakobranchus ocellatus]|uniref:Uncharacterized protein n=1 Tax=Plakobranchus ocellatus TaxID=259542 RepID=A0AAV3ZCK7_9GAST|nr:hypothetical protein PoB_001938500 [Plakobranchus ocellatus]